MSNEVQELLAKIGEKVVRGKVFKLDKKTDPETKQVIISLEGEPRKLILDPDVKVYPVTTRTEMELV